MVIGEESVREEAFLEIEPDTLDWVQFRRVGWRRNQGDVGRNGEVVRAMPTRLIEDHHRMFVISDGFRKAVEEDLHRLSIGVGHHQRKRVVRARLYGGEDIGEGEALVAEPRRALAARPPDMANAALLPDPRFILKKQPDTLVFMRTLNFFQDRRGSF